MSCGTSCGTKTGGCSSGGSCGCSKNNVFDWFSFMPSSFNENYAVVEISFKKGARKGFYRNAQGLDLFKGQLVVVEAAQGFDIGEVSLQGELVKPQMKKRKISERDDTIRNITRIANEEDVNLYLDGRNLENETMVRARAISHSHNIDMKIGDVEYQGDGKKLTIYYIADGRIDFRELVKVYAREFKVKIEMRQIGVRQEAARIGGMGTCGRELCCSTWLQDFKSVTTQAVRYQNLSINTEKMSGQCGRLKCCLNYELDTYNDALKKFPKNADKIETSEGVAYLRKTEILKKEMWYGYEKSGGWVKLGLETVQQLLWMNKQGQKPENLMSFAVVEEKVVDESKHEDLVGNVSLQALEDKARKQRNQQKKQNQKARQQPQSQSGQGQRQQQQSSQQNQEKQGQNRPPQQQNQVGNKPRPQHKNRPNNNNNNSKQNNPNTDDKP